VKPVNLKVVPSAKDGLHCGSLDSDTQLDSEAGRPVRQGRAPLRPGARDEPVGSPGAVVPSAKDGLHCGFSSASAAATAVTVVPSAKDGLHCGCVVGI